MQAWRESWRPHAAELAMDLFAGLSILALTLYVSWKIGVMLPMEKMK